MNQPSPLTWLSRSVTHTGKVRKINEDALLEREDIGLWAVADGMGGHDAGDLASKTIVESLTRVRRHEHMSNFVDDVEKQLLNTNARLRDLAKQQGDDRTIGSTVVTMLAHQHHCTIMWVGDSRAYLNRSGTLTQLSKDHSQVNELVKQGLLLPQDADSHPASNIITRAIGASDEIHIDTDVADVQPGDTFLLCSDGLYQHITPSELGTFLAMDDIEDICNQLLTLTLERGARDNISIIVIRPDTFGTNITDPVEHNNGK